MNDLSPMRMSIDEFFAWAEHRPGKYELVDGVPSLLPYVKLNHDRIVTKLVGYFDRSLDDDAYEIATGDFAVEVGPRSIRYADVMILPAGHDGSTRQVSDAVLLVEVLSDSTMHVDFGAKLSEYKALQSLDTYLIFSQDEPHVWQWTRDKEGNWPVDPLQIKEGEIVVEKLGVRISLERIYLKVN